MSKNSLCFTARWISPEINRKVTAIFFSGYIDCIRDLYGRDRFVPVRSRF